MLEKLRKKNEIMIYTVYDAEFAAYGKIIDKMDVSEICAVAEKMAMPSEGSLYQPSVEAFEQLPIAKQIEDTLFGEMPTQIGYCYGHSNFLNACEWHNCSEVNIAVTPMILILGMRSQISENKLNSADMKVFYVPQGTMIELYATTLHFCPCEVSENGFGCIVALPRGTNTPLEREAADKVLFRKNKWLLAHCENQALLSKGVVAGIYGENIEIKY